MKYVIGNIHGELKKLKKVLQFCNLNTEAGKSKEGKVSIINVITKKF
jgi:hypothetical protein